MQIKFNRVPKQEGKPDQPDMAAQLRAAQQSGVQPRNPQQMPGMDPLNPQQRNPQNPQQGMAQPQRAPGAPGNSQQFNPQQGMAQPQRAPGVQGNSQQFNPQQGMAQKAPQNPQQSMAQAQGNPQTQNPDTNQAKFSEILAAQAQEAGLNTQQPKAAETAEPPKQEEKAPETTEKTDTTAETPAAPKKSARPDFEDFLRGLIGQNIRVHTADKENCTGKLEMVEDGWIRLVNVRSAGTDYYADEDTISIPHIVKVRTSRTIEKDYYNEFMNR